MAPVDREEVARDWAARGFGCDLWVDPPGRCWEDFVHATDEVVIVVEGEMEFEIEGEVARPEIGEELFIPAGAVHSAAAGLMETPAALLLFGVRLHAWAGRRPSSLAWFVLASFFRLELALFAVGFAAASAQPSS